MISLTQHSGKDKSVRTENRSVVEDRELTTKKYKRTFWGDCKVLYLDSLPELLWCLLTSLCLTKFIERHFERVNFTVCKLYFNKLT